MKFEQPREYDDAEVMEAIEEDWVDDLVQMTISVSLNAEYDWAESVCLRLAEHDHENVRGNAILGFGHLARIYRRASTQARHLVSKALQDRSEYVRGKPNVHMMTSITFVDRAPNMKSMDSSLNL